MLSMNVDNEWELFLNGENSQNITKPDISDTVSVPTCSNIYISTKTKIAYLNSDIDLNLVFWKIPVSTYYSNQECVIKKQMKFNSNTPEELCIIEKNLKKQEEDGCQNRQQLGCNFAASATNPEPSTPANMP